MPSMAANNVGMLARMRAAKIPIYAYEESLEDDRQLILAGILEEGSYSMGEFGYRSYLLQRVPNAKQGRVIRACAIFAKELVVRNKSVQYVPIAQLFMWARYALDPRASLEEAANLDGRGYLVVPDISRSIEDWPKHEWQYAQHILARHVNSGGGLILGELDLDEPAPYLPEFLELFSSFHAIPIK